MKLTGWLKIIPITLLLTLFMACSDDNPTGPGGDSEPPALNIKKVEVPQGIQSAANNGDQGAVQVMGYIQFANLLSNFSAYLTPPESAQKISSVSAVEEDWTWTQGDATFKLTLNETTTTYEYTLVVSGTFEGETYNNQTVFEAFTTKDGSSGALDFYEPGISQPVLSFNWETSEEGTYHLVMNINQGSNAATAELYVYADNSGSLDITENSGERWEMQWTANGSSGSWAHYDEQGSLVNEGGWS